MDDKKETWEQQSGHWVRQAADPRNKYTRLLDLVAAKVAATIRPGAALDVGCGPGALCERLAGLGFDVYGTDIAEKMVKAAAECLRQRLPDADSRFRVCGDADLPFKDMRFNLITAIQMFNYIEQFEPFIAQLKGMLQPGGVIVATSTNRRGLWVWHEILNRLFRIPPHLRTLRNLWRTGYHSGGCVDYRRARQAYTASAFDAMFRKQRFEVLDPFDYYHIAWLDGDPLGRKGFSRKLARHLAWQHVGVYQLPVRSEETPEVATR